MVIGTPRKFSTLPKFKIRVSLKVVKKKMIRKHFGVLKKSKD